MTAPPGLGGAGDDARLPTALHDVPPDCRQGAALHVIQIQGPWSPIAGPETTARGAEGRLWAGRIILNLYGGSGFWRTSSAIDIYSTFSSYSGFSAATS